MPDRDLAAITTIVRTGLILVAWAYGGDPWLWLLAYAATGPALRAIHANAVEAHADREWQRRRDAMRSVTNHPSQRRPHS